jgi:YVTN family beta-propeller protein
LRSLDLFGRTCWENDYVPNLADGTLSAIDAASDEVTAVITLPAPFPEGVAVIRDGQYVGRLV